MTVDNRKTKQYQLKLYIAGINSSAERALENIRRIAEEHLEENYEIEVIDLEDHPEKAEEAQIFAVPTLVRKLPPPLRKIVGDLSNEEKVLVGLDLRAKGS